MRSMLLAAAVVLLAVSASGQSNDECQNAQFVNVPSTATFSNSGATTSQPAWTCGQGQNDVWFAVYSPQAGFLTIDTCGPNTNYDTTLEAFTGVAGSCSQLQNPVCNDDACGPTGLSSRVTFTAAQNVYYFFRVGGFQGATGQFDLNVAYTTSPPPQLNTITPASALMDAPPFLLTASGANFTNTPPASVIRFATVPLTTTYLGSTLLRTQLNIVGVAPGLHAIDVETPGVGVSAPRTFTILAPVPQIRHLRPPIAIQGNTALTTLVIAGTGFAPNASVTLNGLPLTILQTTRTEIRAQLLPGQVASAGYPLVRVVNPAPGGGTSPARRWRVAVPHSYEVLSADSSGVPANADSLEPSVSENSRFVVFASHATNLDPRDTNGVEDVFVRDRVEQTAALVSLGTNDQLGDADSFGPSISDDGRYVLFCSYASTFRAAPGPGGNLQVWRRDRDTDDDGVFDEPGAVATILISTPDGTNYANAVSRITSRGVSNNGSKAAFVSAASNLASGVPGGVERIYIREIVTPSVAFTRVVSNTPGLVLGNGMSGDPSISGDGNWVVFSTEATNLFSPDQNGAIADVVRKNLATGAVDLVSRGSGAAGAQGNGRSQRPGISRDGGVVSFATRADNLGVPGADTNGQDDIYRRDMTAATTQLISFTGSNTAANGASLLASVTPTGCTIFASLASDFLGGDTNGLPDVYAWKSPPASTPPIFPLSMYRYPDGSIGNGASGVDTNGAILGLSAAADADFVAFGTRAANLAMSSPIFPVLDTSYIGGTVAPFTSLVSPEPDENPVTFSVSGPVDEQGEGLLNGRGTGASVPFTFRLPAVPPAQGTPTARPGDVRLYFANVPPIPAEAELFQSEPEAPTAAAPSGTNNQIVTAARAGLIAGTPVATYHDNIDAVSFGEDFFGVRGVSAAVVPVQRSWALRPATATPEPVVTTDVGTSFRFSVDPWATGTPVSAVREESLGFDTGPMVWSSPGDAAGDVYATPVLVVPGPAPGLNTVVHEQSALALAPPPAPPVALREDDLDALECVGDNDPSTWVSGATGPEQPGNLHARVEEGAGPELPTPLSARHTVTEAPVFFSVDRNSTGAALTAVRTQWVFGEAAGDVFVMRRRTGSGIDSNYLLIDETELGLYAPAVPLGERCDNLDALVLAVHPDDRTRLLSIIATLPAPTVGNPAAPPAAQYLVGPGYSQSIVSYVAATTPSSPLRIRVGFSVSSDSIGLEGTAVDHEAGRETTMQQAGDVFFTQFGTWPDAPTIANTFPASPLGANWLWYEETALGLDSGSWTWPLPGSPTLDLLPDELDGLDSICTAPTFGGELSTFGFGCPGSGGFTPILTPTGWPVGGRAVAMTLHECLGGTLAFIAFGGPASSFTLSPFSPQCPLLMQPGPGTILAIVSQLTTGTGPGNGTAVHQIGIAPGIPAGSLVAQAIVLDPGAPNGLGVVSNGALIGYR